MEAGEHAEAECTEVGGAEGFRLADRHGIGGIDRLDIRNGGLTLGSSRAVLTGVIVRLRTFRQLSEMQRALPIPSRLRLL